MATFQVFLILLLWLSVAGVVYTYAGYPLLLTLLTYLRRPYQVRSFEQKADLPEITLLIAAYNEQDVIASKLENSLAQDYPAGKLHILVAADGSQDRTVEIVGGFASQGVGLSYQSERLGKLAAIDRAMEQARGEIVVFSDANNLYNREALLYLAAPFADPSVGVVVGSKTIQRGDGALGESEGLYWKYESYIKIQETRLGCCTAAAGEILAVRRNLFEPAPKHIINDDFFITMRLIGKGYRVVYTPQARSTERISLTAQDEIARRSRIIAGRYQAIGLSGRLLPWRRPLIVWQIISHKFLRPLVPFAMLGALLANIILVVAGWPAGSAEWRNIYNLLLAGQVIFYLLAWLGGKFQRDTTLGRLLYLPAFLMNSNLAALLGLYRYLTHQQSALWKRVERRQ